jgi:hypothetical protein
MKNQPKWYVRAVRAKDLKASAQVRDEGPYPTKKVAYAAALSLFRALNPRTTKIRPIQRIGHTYIVAQVEH